jgi:hypothetical protein
MVSFFFKKKIVKSGNGSGKKMTVAVAKNDSGSGKKNDSGRSGSVQYGSGSWHALAVAAV